MPMAQTLGEPMSRGRRRSRRPPIGSLKSANGVRAGWRATEGRLEPRPVPTELRSAAVRSVGGLTNLDDGSALPGHADLMSMPDQTQEAHSVIGARQRRLQRNTRTLRRADSLVASGSCRCFALAGSVRCRASTLRSCRSGTRIGRGSLRGRLRSASGSRPLASSYVCSRTDRTRMRAGASGTRGP